MNILNIILNFFKSLAPSLFKENDETEVLEIVRRNHKQTVRKVKLSSLERVKCSHKLRRKNLDPNTLVYVSCDKEGNFELRDKKNNRKEYRIYPV